MPPPSLPKTRAPSKSIGPTKSVSASEQHPRFPRNHSPSGVNDLQPQPTPEMAPAIAAAKTKVPQPRGTSPQAASFPATKPPSSNVQPAAPIPASNFRPAEAATKPAAPELLSTPKRLTDPPAIPSLPRPNSPMVAKAAPGPHVAQKTMNIATRHSPLRIAPVQSPPRGPPTPNRNPSAKRLSSVPQPPPSPPAALVAQQHRMRSPDNYRNAAPSMRPPPNSYRSPDRGNNYHDSPPSASKSTTTLEDRGTQTLDVQDRGTQYDPRLLPPPPLPLESMSRQRPVEQSQVATPANAPRSRPMPKNPPPPAATSTFSEQRSSPAVAETSSANRNVQATEPRSSNLNQENSQPAKVVRKPTSFKDRSGEKPELDSSTAVIAAGFLLQYANSGAYRALKRRGDARTTLFEEFLSEELMETLTKQMEAHSSPQQVRPGVTAPYFRSMINVSAGPLESEHQDTLKWPLRIDIVLLEVSKGAPARRLRQELELYLNSDSAFTESLEYYRHELADALVPHVTGQRGIPTIDRDDIAIQRYDPFGFRDTSLSPPSVDEESHIAPQASRQMKAENDGKSTSKPESKESITFAPFSKKYQVGHHSIAVQFGRFNWSNLSDAPLKRKALAEAFVKDLRNTGFSDQTWQIFDVTTGPVIEAQSGVIISGELKSNEPTMAHSAGDVLRSYIAQPLSFPLTRLCYCDNFGGSFDVDGAIAVPNSSVDGEPVPLSNNRGVVTSPKQWASTDMVNVSTPAPSPVALRTGDIFEDIPSPPRATPKALTTTTPHQQPRAPVPVPVYPKATEIPKVDSETGSNHHRSVTAPDFISMSQGQVVTLPPGKGATGLGSGQSMIRCAFALPAFDANRYAETRSMLLHHTVLADLRTACYNQNVADIRVKYVRGHAAIVGAHPTWLGIIAEIDCFLDPQVADATIGASLRDCIAGSVTAFAGLREFAGISRHDPLVPEGLVDVQTFDAALLRPSSRGSSAKGNDPKEASNPALHQSTPPARPGAANHAKKAVGAGRRTEFPVYITMPEYDAIAFERACDADQEFVSQSHKNASRDLYDASGAGLYNKMRDIGVKVYGGENPADGIVVDAVIACDESQREEVINAVRIYLAKQDAMQKLTSVLQSFRRELCDYSPERRVVYVDDESVSRKR